MGVRVSIENVSTIAGGHTILRDLKLEIPAGSHVAIVGPSGAGKSSFAGLMLGWSVPASGTLLVDGQPLTGENLEQLRRETAWIDPTVQLWNRSLVDNLRFGLPGEPAMPLGESIEHAELLSLIDKLPDGLQTKLGEGGALVSGGEGQRVRIGRALLRSGVRLAILDEPFRGLDATTRQELLRRLRRAWGEATLVFISHDVAETQLFDRVLVMQSGTVIEDGAPAQLLEKPGSRYAALLNRELELRSRLLEGAEWRRLRMQQGVLSEHPNGSLRTCKLPARERIA
ncbi:MAG: ATP-binding cassette domain-containing protein [Bradyrhizobium sp.]|nr:ATP-binding cassette domain-containing protein [Bradyrhizobium sp.]